MPALHVVGEIVGASGLRPREALSVAHWLDALSLHPSSARSFFCRWRLAFHGKGDAWRVLQGASRGQTQVHAWSAVTPLEETITTTSGRRREGKDDPEAAQDASQDLVELETLWSHPIDLHLAVTDLPPLPGSWPFLQFQVWSLDEFHRERLVGTASTPLPAAQHEFFLDLPLTKATRAASLAETVAEVLDLNHGDAQAPWKDNQHEDDEEDEDQTVVTTSVGSLYLRIAIVPQGMLARGILS